MQASPSFLDLPRSNSPRSLSQPLGLPPGTALPSMPRKSKPSRAPGEPTSLWPWTPHPQGLFIAGTGDGESTGGGGGLRPEHSHAAQGGAEGASVSSWPWFSLNSVPRGGENGAGFLKRSFLGMVDGGWTGIHQNSPHPSSLPLEPRAAELRLKAWGIFPAEAER